MPEREDVSQVEIEPWAVGDLDLLRRNNAPEMTEHLGGPETDEQVVARHARYLAMTDPTAGQMFRIVLLPECVSVGGIGYWEKEWRGETVYEIGWGVLPPFQGRGIAAAAAAAVIERARDQRTHRTIHAFPSVANPASNAICRNLGFMCFGEHDFEYPKGSWMRCNEWRFQL